MIIEHHGVKGMKWGVRKGDAGSAHQNFSTAQQQGAIDRFGEPGARRINNRLHEGMTLQQATRREHILQAGKTAVAVGAVIVPILIHEFGGEIASKIHQKAETNRGRDAIPAIEKKPAPKVVKPNRKGVHKITNL